MERHLIDNYGTVMKLFVEGSKWRTEIIIFASRFTLVKKHFAHELVVVIASFGGIFAKADRVNFATTGSSNAQFRHFELSSGVENQWRIITLFLEQPVDPKQRVRVRNTAPEFRLNKCDVRHQTVATATCCRSSEPFPAALTESGGVGEWLNFGIRIVQ